MLPHSSQKKASKLKKVSSFEDTDTDQESTSSASRAPLHHNKYDTPTHQCFIQTHKSPCRKVNKEVLSVKSSDGTFESVIYSDHIYFVTVGIVEKSDYQTNLKLTKCGSFQRV